MFVDCISQAKELYKSRVLAELSQRREVLRIDRWQVPQSISYNSKYNTMPHQRSIMEPLYVKKPSGPEKRFIELIEHSNKVKWWFRKGENEVKYFATRYKDENDTESAFYVDFIVRSKDGALGLFDTKSGQTAQDAGPRSNGLQMYIKAQKKKGRKVTGGIVIFDDGSARYYPKPKYHYNPHDLSNWEILSM